MMQETKPECNHNYGWTGTGCLLHCKDKVEQKEQTKPERQSVEEIINDILCLGGTNFKQRLIDAIQSERLISDKLREENEELKSIRTNALKFLDTELCDNHFATAKNQSFHDFNKSQKDAGCRLCLRQENEELKKRVDSEYNRGIEDAEKVACHHSKAFQVSVQRDCCMAAEAILKLRRG